MSSAAERLTCAKGPRQRRPMLSEPGLDLSGTVVLRSRLYERSVVVAISSQVVEDHILPQKRECTMTNIPGYEMGKELKTGGFGTAYLATQKALNRRCVIKILNHSDDETIKRFINEARAASAISNPGIVQIYDLGQTASGDLYLVMEHIDQGSLWDKLNLTTSPSIPNRSFCLMIRQIASILNDVHEAGIFHRDLSPGNIMFASDPLSENGERVKIIDLGLAKVPKAIQHGSLTPVSTSMGVSFGTPGFTAPEAHQSVKSVTSACDVWSLGAIIYYALARQPADIDWTAHEPPKALIEINAATPQWLSELVEKMLAFKASSRPSMNQICRALDSQLSHSAMIPAPKSVFQDTLYGQIANLNDAECKKVYFGGFITGDAQLASASCKVDMDSQVIVFSFDERAIGVGRLHVPLAAVSACFKIDGILTFCVKGRPYNPIRMDGTIKVICPD